MSEDPEGKLQRFLDATELPDTPEIRLSDCSRIVENAGKNELHIELGYPCQKTKKQIERYVGALLESEELDVDRVIVDQTISASQLVPDEANVTGVKNIIAVASGKGGVGKSTTSVNIALALAYEGAKVGLLDADIYGPSQPHMLGVGSKRPEMASGQTVVPVPTHGIHLISMGNLVTERTPMVWRGPMASGALQQLLRNTQWPDVDYLVVDMPPGTGDIQLTLSQTVPVSGSIIVTTPQDIALLDAKKGIEMFRKVNIPVLGVVENMSTYTCPKCGHQEDIFGGEGGEKLAADYGVTVLGKLPLDMKIREQTDGGAPPIVVDPHSEVSAVYRKIAISVAMQLWRNIMAGSAGPQISIADD